MNENGSEIVEKVNSITHQQTPSSNFVNSSAGETPICSNVGCLNRIRGMVCLVEELREQNEGLVETVVELESEVENRVNGIEELLARTAETAKAYMVKLDEYEELTGRAFRDKIKMLKYIKKLKNKFCNVVEEKNNIQDQNNNLTHDITSLVKLVTHARNTGQWDKQLEERFSSKFNKEINVLSCSSNRSEDEKCTTPNSFSDHHSLLYNQLKKSSPDQLAPYLPTLCSCRNGFHTRRDAHVIQLQGELNRTRKILAALENDLSERDRTIAELQVQITDLNHEISRREADCFVHVQQQQLDTHSRHISSFESIELLDTKCLELDTGVQAEAAATICAGCGDRLKVIEQLRDENRTLSDECAAQQLSLEKCCSDIEAALVTNSKLEQELSVTESLWQELEAIKEENETLLDKLEKKCKKEKEMEKRLRSSKELSDNAEKMKGDLAKLKEAEERHRVKANGLEAVIQQMQTQLGQRNEELNHVDEIEQLKKSKLEQQVQINELVAQLERLQRESSSDAKVAAVEERLSDVGKELQVTLSLLRTRDEEIERQKATIGNLQEAVVTLKRSTSSSQLTANNNGQISPAQNSHIKRYTSSGDVIDI